MSDVHDFMPLLQRARASGDLDELVRVVPYSSFLGLEMHVEGDRLVGKLPFLESNIGNYSIPALHGGATGAFLESVAVFELLYRSDTATLPKVINISIEYLRTARAKDMFSRAELIQRSRRVATVRAVAFQDDDSHPVAAATVHLLLVSPEELHRD